MKNLVKDLWLVVVLILGASLLLLLSDLEQREGAPRREKGKLKNLALIQLSSSSLLDTHVSGVIDRLTEKGFLAPDKKNLRHFNAMGDIGMANTIAREVTNGPYDLVITSSTVMLQTFAKANQQSMKIHVFGAVTDPYGAGVGITGAEPENHPPYLVGIGSFQPVATAFRIARELKPGLKRIGVVWNPGEQCSDACVKEARAICEELGITLVEAIATNTNEVSEALRSLLSKNVEAIWIGGDTVAISSLGLMVSLGKQSGIPVFTNAPDDALHGALFGLGANYYTVGQLTADLAIEIMEGKNPAEIRVENIVPEMLTVNEAAFEWLDDSWAMNEVVRNILDKQREAFALQKTDTTSSTTGSLETKSGPSIQKNRLLKLRIVQYSETEFAENCLRGLKDGIRKAGLLEGRDFELKFYNAQGDMSTLSSIMSSVKSDRVDLLMVISTPTLQAALRQAGPDTKIVFTGVGDAVKAGAGKTETDHLPNVTGITTRSPFDEMARLIKESIPSVRRIGTLFTPAEINSVLYKDWFLEALRKEGLELVAMPVTASAEIPQATAELCGKDIQVLCQIVDNLTRPAYPLIARKAAEYNLPLFSFDSDQMKDGGAVCLARDYYDSGLEAAIKAVRVLKGESPASIPFSNTQSQKRIYNPEMVKKYNIRLSPVFLANATEFKKP
jgi:ABC-type uncharacterized transport system substrate-binding protein